jgi:hypothetical protein
MGSPGQYVMGTPAFTEQFWPREFICTNNTNKVNRDVINFILKVYGLYNFWLCALKNTLKVTKFLHSTFLSMDKN